MVLVAWSNVRFGHHSPIDAKSAHQGFNASVGLVVGVAGEMGVAGGGENGVMAQNLLHFQQVDPGLDQVGCIAVTPMSLER